MKLFLFEKNSVPLVCRAEFCCSGVLALHHGCRPSCDHEFGGVNDGGAAFVSPNALAGDGVERSKYILESSVTPKSWFDPVSWILLNASRKSALCASSRLSRKSMVSLTFLSSICL